VPETYRFFFGLPPFFGLAVFFGLPLFFGPAVFFGLFPPFCASEAACSRFLKFPIV
jgi:hypothetical protein